MKTLILGSIALAAMSTSSIAAGSHSSAHPKPAALICPVTGTKIASIKDAAGHETYKGKTYYFCCPECKPRFDQNRALIVKHASQGKFEKM